MSMTSPELDIHHMIHELTTEWRHREPYTDEAGTQRHHTTTVPALIAQLIGATPASSGAETRGAAVSKPAARIEALDTLALIDTEAGEWIDKLGGTIPADVYYPGTTRVRPGVGTVKRLQRLHGLHPNTTSCDRPKHARDKTEGQKRGPWCCDRGNIEGAIHRWWHQARIITGWDVPAFRPNENTCPACEVRGTLRINLEILAGICIACGVVWDSTQIELLAAHIRWENDDEDEPTLEEPDDTLNGSGLCA